MKKNILCFVFITALISAIYAQAGDDYEALYNSKEYDKSYNIILSKLNQIYSKRVEDRKIPAGYIALSNVGEDSDLLTLFRQRKEKGFFIEDNPELSELHFYAARCAAQLDKKKDSLNHYVQALRFRKLEQTRDDVIYYEISGIFKTYREPVYFKGYIDALEQAYSLNPSNFLYSYEIGDALSVTKEKKKSIFHLKRYLDNTDDEVKPEVYLKLGGLYESIGKYLDTEKYYNEYLRRKPEDAEILFALGYISYSKTGNYILAESSLQRALKILKESDIYRRSKSYEYLGDMAYNNLKYDKALLFYNECINFQSKILELISSKNNEKKNLTLEINKLKEALINNKEFEKYEDYEILIDERNKIDKELEILQLEFNKLQPGRIRWFMAVSYEKIEKYNEAIAYYRESIRYNYNSNLAREMIVKLQLKIKRGY
jgi:tetratricopeptide (TPR) repeat protein